MLRKYVKVIRRLFSTKDDAFWENYSKMKAQGGKFPVLGAQGARYNKTCHNWKFSDKYSLINSEFLECLKDIDKDPPYIIMDVREEIEFELFKLPYKNKAGMIIPIIYRSMDEINNGNITDLSLDKYIICIDSIGLRSRRASQILYNEGFLTLYVEGGYDMLISYMGDDSLI
jgi:rhodanese-related sulfurtransferase